MIVTKGENYFAVLEGRRLGRRRKIGPPAVHGFSDESRLQVDADTRELSVHMTKSGYSGSLLEFTGHPVTTQYGAPIYVYDFGANGIALDPQGRVVLAAHGDREVVRIERDGSRQVVATGYQGVRFYHPNEMVIKSNGSIYVTDARPSAPNDPAVPNKYGTFLIKDGAVSLVVPGQSHGLAFSPDEKYFYLTTYGSQAIMRYDVLPDDTLANGRVFIDMSVANARGAPNGMAVDSEGNVYTGGPGGLWIMNPDGKHIGTIPLPAIANGAVFGGSDLKTLYIMDARNLLEVRTKVPGMLEPARLSRAESR